MAGSRQGTQLHGSPLLALQVTMSTAWLVLERAWSQQLAQVATHSHWLQQRLNMAFHTSTRHHWARMKRQPSAVHLCVLFCTKGDNFGPLVCSSLEKPELPFTVSPQCYCHLVDLKKTNKNKPRNPSTQQCCSDIMALGNCSAYIWVCRDRASALSCRMDWCLVNKNKCQQMLCACSCPFTQTFLSPLTRHKTGKSFYNTR